MSSGSNIIPSADPLEISWLNDPLNYAVRCFIAFLQTIFERAPRGAFHWSPDSRSAEIVITEENPVNLESVEKKPIISVIEGPIKFNSTTLDDLVRTDPKTGEEFHTDLLPGTMSLNCLSRVRQEARFIAWISARTIWNLRKLFIRETYFQEIGRGITIGSVTPAGALVQGDTEGEWHVCTVTCPFFLQWSDSITPLKEDWSGAPIRSLQSIQAKINGEGPALTAQLDKIPLQRPEPRCWGTEPKPPRRKGRLITQAQTKETPAVVTKPLRQGFKV